MKISIFKSSPVLLALSALCGAMISFGYYPVFFRPLLILGLIILFAVVKASKNARFAFFAGWIAGIFYFGPLLYFVKYVSFYAMVVLILYQGVFIAFFAYLVKKVRQFSQGFECIAAPFLWVAIEFTRGFGEIGFPWMFIGNSFDADSGLGWIAQIGGVFLISFLIVSVVSLFVYVFEKKARISVRIAGFVTVCVITLLLFKSSSMVNNKRVLPVKNILAQPRGEHLIKIALIQPSICQNKKWDSNYEEFILDRLRDLTLDAALAFPELIIWPESALPGVISDDEEIDEFIRGICSQINTALLIGVQTSKFEEGKKRYYNSAILYSYKGEKVAQYDKCQLVPFGEYVPLEKIMFFAGNLSPIDTGFSRGSERTIFDLSQASPRINFPCRFGVSICYEDLFPAINRYYVKKGAAFLVNLTNDSWYGYSAAPFLHAIAASMRCIENGVQMIRCTNTGLTCLINKDGIITDIAGDKTGILFRPNVLLLELNYSEREAPTVYNITGDLIAYVSLAMTVLLVVSYVVRKTKE